VATRVKLRLVHRRQLLQERLLYPPVFHVRYPQSALLSVPFRYPHPPHRVRSVSTGEKLTPQALCSVSILTLDVLHRTPIWAGRTSVRLHSTECFSEVVIRDHTFEGHVPWGCSCTRRATRLRLGSCPARQSRAPHPLDIRGRLPSSLSDWGTVSRTFRYYAAIRLLSSLHHFVLSFSAITKCISPSEAERSPWVRP
jgi:hypothetical protein